MLRYTLALRTDAGVDDVSARLHALLGTPAPAALDVRVSAVTHPVLAEELAEQLGAPATAEVVLAVDTKAPEDEVQHAERALAVAVARLVVETDALACLTVQLDRAVLRRTGSDLVLYAWFTPWSDPEVLLVLPPHTLTDDEQSGLAPGASPLT